MWNYGKPGAATAPYADHAGFDLRRAWNGLGQVRVERSVDAHGKLSLWDRPLRVGTAWTGRTVVVTFDPERHLAVVRDPHETPLVERPLPCLTTDWIR